jgi:hypothetical protein
MSGYWAQLVGWAAALLLAPAATAPLPHQRAMPAGTETAVTEWSNCLDCHPKYASELPRLSDLRPAGLGTTMQVSCTSCHAQADLLLFPSDWSHPVRPVGSHVSCTACHAGGPHTAEAPPALPTGDYDAQGCFSCHPQVQLDFSASLGHDNHPAIRCKDCHPPHGPLQAGLPAELLPPGTRAVWQRNYDWRASNDLCLRCHQPGELFFFTNQGGFVTANTANYHELHVIDGQALCIECHNPHGGARDAFMRERLITGEVLSYYREMDGGTCAVNCHGVQHDYWKYTNKVF